MKKTIFYFVAAFIGSSTLAQTGSNYAKNDNVYSKKMQPPPVTDVQVENLHFSIIKVEGNSKTGLVTIEMLIKNKGSKLEAFSSKARSITDMNGYEYQVDKAFLGIKDATVFAFTDLYNFTPLKCRYIFKGLSPEVKVIKLFNHPVEYHIPGATALDFQNKTAAFSNLNIDWK